MLTRTDTYNRFLMLNKSHLWEFKLVHVPDRMTTHSEMQGFPTFHCPFKSSILWSKQFVFILLS